MGEEGLVKDFFFTEEEEGMLELNTPQGQVILPVSFFLPKKNKELRTKIRILKKSFNV